MIARWFWREWRSPSLLIVWLALSLAVACVLALGSVSDRMEKGLSQQSRDFMAGDRALRSPVNPAHRFAWLDRSAQRGAEGEGAAQLPDHDLRGRHAAAGQRQSRR